MTTNKPLFITTCTVLLAATYMIPSGAGAAPAARGAGLPTACEVQAKRAQQGRWAEAQADYYTGLGICLNLTDPVERAECVAAARDTLHEGRDAALSNYEARLELCAQLPVGVYHPDIDPDDFSTTIDNPWYPLVPGAVRTYEVDTAEGFEVVEVTVTSDTVEIMGVECVVVNDIVTLDGDVIEDTLDYYAQDSEGNVWYFGETARDYEDGFLVSIGGSFLGGIDGAEPGLIMPATPMVGRTFRQEFALGEAEDAATILALDATANVPFGMFTNCLRTRDFTPLEPDAEENKFYAMGVGPVMEINPDTGEVLELVSVTP